MALVWDRLLETCIHRKATDILLSPGASPMIRLAESWRSLQVPSVDIETIRALASAKLGQKPAGRDEGFSYSDIEYEEGVKFRLTAFGYPATNALLISLCGSGGSADDNRSEKATK